MSKKSQVVSGLGLGLGMLTLADEVRRACGISDDLFHTLSTPAGRKHWEAMFVSMSAPIEPPEPKVYLQQLYAGETIIIGPTDGTRTIAQAGDVFAAGIDSDFRSWNLDVPAQATEAMEVGVHELILDGDFKSVYGSLRHSLDQLRLTPHQIVDFCVKHKDKLHLGGHGTFFLFKIGDEYFVANVNVHSDGHLYMLVYRFSNIGVWGVEFRPHFVFPQLEPLVA
jgi:hypothetical protein